MRLYASNAAFTSQFNAATPKPYNRPSTVLPFVSWARTHRAVGVRSEQLAAIAAVQTSASSMRLSYTTSAVELTMPVTRSAAMLLLLSISFVCAAVAYVFRNSTFCIFV